MVTGYRLSSALAGGAFLVLLCAPAGAVDLSADVSIGGSHGVNVDVDASLGGKKGVEADASASTGGRSGVDADASATAGGMRGIDANSAPASAAVTEPTPMRTLPLAAAKAASMPP